MGLILVTGASGHVGGRVAAILAARGERLRLLVRDAGRAPAIPGADVVVGDYAHEANLEAAFADVTRAFVVSGNAEPMKRAQLHGNAFRAAARAGVEHVVYLSFQGARPASPFPMGRDHFLSEELLDASGVAYTSLRDNLYMELLPEMFDAQGVLRGPAGEGRVAWVSREDVAEVVAAALVAPGPAREVVDVTGPEALTLAETAARLSALAGRPLRSEDESVEEGRRWRSKLGAAAWEVETWLGSYCAIAAGDLARVSGTVERLTGHPPHSLEQCFSTHPRLLAGRRAA